VQSDRLEIEITDEQNPHVVMAAVQPARSRLGMRAASNNL
jgi:hypothetical protein